jgi:hypothetical protein
MSQRETAPERGTSSGQGAEPGAPRGGFASQPLWLRILLIASVCLVAAGIVRCSIESTAPVAGAVSSVAVMPVLVDAPEGFFTQPGDSVAVMAAKWFTRSFVREAGIRVDIIPPSGVVNALSDGAGYDGLAYFRLERVHDEAEGEYRLHIHGEMIHSVTKRAMATVDYEAPAAFLYRRMTEAGVEMALKMGYQPDGEARGER